MVKSRSVTRGLDGACVLASVLVISLLFHTRVRSDDVAKPAPAEEFNLDYARLEQHRTSPDIEWQSLRYHYFSKHPSYGRIKAMGTAAVPLLIEKLRQRVSQPEHESSWIMYLLGDISGQDLNKLHLGLPADIECNLSPQAWIRWYSRTAN
jgi:hypothetical protein